jgi:hypothetical protein
MRFHLKNSHLTNGSSCLKSDNNTFSPICTEEEICIECSYAKFLYIQQKEQKDFKISQRKMIKMIPPWNNRNQTHSALYQGKTYCIMLKIL